MIVIWTCPTQFWLWGKQGNGAAKVCPEIYPWMHWNSPMTTGMSLKLPYTSKLSWSWPFPTFRLACISSWTWKAILPVFLLFGCIPETQFYALVICNHDLYGICTFLYPGSMLKYSRRFWAWWNKYPLYCWAKPDVQVRFINFIPVHFFS